MVERWCKRLLLLRSRGREENRMRILFDMFKLAHQSGILITRREST
jgi:hypothetical protein